MQAPYQSGLGFVSGVMLCPYKYGLSNSSAHLSHSKFSGSDITHERTKAQRVKVFLLMNLSPLSHGKFLPSGRSSNLPCDLLLPLLILEQKWEEGEDKLRARVTVSVNPQQLEEQTLRQVSWL